MFKRVEDSNSKYHFFQDLMFSCAVLNNDLAINTTKTLNERKKADIIMAFDFRTLHTKIPHNA